MLTACLILSLVRLLRQTRSSCVPHGTGHPQGRAWPCEGNLLRGQSHPRSASFLCDRTLRPPSPRHRHVEPRLPFSFGTTFSVTRVARWLGVVTHSVSIWWKSGGLAQRFPGQATPDPPRGLGGSGPQSVCAQCTQAAMQHSTHRVDRVTRSYFLSS